MQPHATYYTTHNTNIITYTPEYGDHKALILYLLQIRDMQHHKSKRTHINPTTRRHPPFIIPIPQNLIDLYRLGTASVKANTQHITQTTAALLTYGSTTTDQIDCAAAQVITIIFEYHDIANKTRPLHPPRLNTMTPVQLKSLISRAGLRQIG